MKFTAIFALVASTQAVHLSSTQKVEIKAQAETMNQAMVDISAQMEESQKTLSELQEKFDLFDPASWWSIRCSIISNGTQMKPEQSCKDDALCIRHEIYETYIKIEEIQEICPCDLVWSFIFLYSVQ